MSENLLEGFLKWMQTNRPRFVVARYEGEGRESSVLMEYEGAETEERANAIWLRLKAKGGLVDIYQTAESTFVVDPNQVN